MAVTWTKEQRQVIELRRRNILVSAAAGSGKTAVLVERILSLITEGEHPLDIDRLLIVTFTRAAASEMRERVRQGIEKRLEEAPDNAHLQRQSTLIHNAQINTIDGFCSYVLRNYFSLIDLDPGYRTAEEGELRLLKRDTVHNLLEEAFAAGDADFLQFVECYAAGKNDGFLEDLILQLYEYSMSYPWPEEWLMRCAGQYQADTVEELMQSEWMRKLERETEKNLRGAEELTLDSLRLCDRADGPRTYREALECDLQIIRSLLRTQDFDERTELLQNMKFKALSRKQCPQASPDNRERVKEARRQVRETLEELRDSCYFRSLEQVLESMRLCRAPVGALVKQTLAFLKAFAAAKREKNIVDFSDMEHFALDILLKKDEEGNLSYTQAAGELADRFEEIFIDEYQDSNLVQETILNAVSRMREGQFNLFMVGDVKQSIYRFRLARPELFMEKFRTYAGPDEKHQRIDLHRNFRSRREVLSGINYIFRQIMGEGLGGVEYDEEAALYPGMEFPEGNRPGFAATEVLLVETDTADADSGELGSARELEALTVAGRIRSMVGRELVLDRETGEYRPVRYGDIVILLRTMSGWAEVFGQVLAGQGIPSYCTSKTGYFSAPEVVTVLNYLHILDNPRQDIPYGAILRSPIVGCTAEEMANVRLMGERENYCVCVEYYLQRGDDDELRDKLGRFRRQYDLLRARVAYTPIHELIQAILRETGYEYFAAAMPAGEQREANLRMLAEKAMEFEQTSYRGLFNFVRYIEHLQKYNVDFGEVGVSAGDDLVQIMSIHKSKGLEFPIVFVSGMAKRFNQQDVNASLVFHPDLGVGVDCILPEKRTKYPTLLKEMIRHETKIENLGEELRVLYVAMTRAREKLLLTGTIKDLKGTVLSCHWITDRQEEKLSYRSLEKAPCYFSWILSALARHPAFQDFYEQFGLAGNPENPLYQKEVPIALSLVTPWDLAADQVEKQAAELLTKEDFLQWDCDTVYDEKLRGQLEERFSYRYPYEDQADIPVKVTVSELKRQQRDEDSYELYFEPDVVPLIPEFMKEQEEEYEGARRGTAYHRLLECLDLTRISSEEEILRQISLLQETGKLDPRMAACIRPEDIRIFAESSLGQRMKKAQQQGNLRREQPFVIARPASSMKARWGEDVDILVQGIIDAYFQEGEELVLADYKTDRVLRPEELAGRYRVQLEHYAEALERLTGRTVREKIIYSFFLGREIRL